MTTSSIRGVFRPALGSGSVLSGALPPIGLDRIRDVAVHAIGQPRVWRSPYAGVMHTLIAGGVVAQLLGTSLNILQMGMFVPGVAPTFPRGAAYLAFEALMDAAGLAIIVGVGMALARRLRRPAASLTTGAEDVAVLLLLGAIPVAGFLLEATRLLAVAPSWSAWSPVGNLVASALRLAGVSGTGASAVHDALFWVHAGLALSLVALLPYTKLRHIAVIPLNIALRPRRHIGALPYVDGIEEREAFGVGRIADFDSSQLLALDACTNCGRCETVCPATASGSEYSPRLLVQTLRSAAAEGLYRARPAPWGADSECSLPLELAWSCTTCGACTLECPSFLRPVDFTIELRRYLTMNEGKVAKPVADTLRNLERSGNPWAMPAADRAGWARALGVRELTAGEKTQVLLFAGCAAAYDPRNRRALQSLVRLLQVAGVDFAVLADGEGCCGESARRLGHEYLFQELAAENLRRLGEVGFDAIVTSCAHCYNSLRNEYPQMGADFVVMHHTEFLTAVAPGLDLAPAGGVGFDWRVAYHDPCYLSRCNGVRDEPRALLDLVVRERVELALSGRNSFCCGGGGGQMWMESDSATGTRINHLRLGHALDAGAEVLATACPYCLLMLEDATRTLGLSDEIQILDIAEILAKQIEAIEVDAPAGLLVWPGIAPARSEVPESVS